MAKDIRNQVQLQNEIMKDIQKAVDNTVIRLLEELENTINRVVYGAGTPKAYERTMQLLHTWKSNPSIITGKQATGEITPEWDTMVTNKNKHQHIVTGAELVELLSTGWGDKESWFNSPRDFWDEFKNYVDSNADKIFMEEMDKIQGKASLSVNFS